MGAQQARFHAQTMRYFGILAPLRRLLASLTTVHCLKNEKSRIVLDSSFGFPKQSYDIHDDHMQLEGTQTV
jgi:3-phosphoglycerate kinase